MSAAETEEATAYILGAGAVGFPLAVFLAKAGRRVIAVRTSKVAAPSKVRVGVGEVSAELETTSLSRLARIDGVIAVTAKSYANPEIARRLVEKGATGPVVILQNGLGVERPFVEAAFPEIYRCVLYVTGQSQGENAFLFRPITASALGIIRGDEAGLRRCVEALSTEGFPFRAEPNIQREVWKKAIINTVFNSLCPLLQIDNGVFAREPEVAQMARELIHECVALTDRLELGLTATEIMDQLLRISRGSDGQLISTLQDIQRGRPTEIDSLNLEIARAGASLEPKVPLPRVELLGRMILALSGFRSPRPS